MYRITQLAGHEIYRIEVLKPWLFGHWGRPVWNTIPAAWRINGRGRTVVATYDFNSLAKAQEKVAILKIEDNERLARSLGLWRVIWP